MPQTVFFSRIHDESLALMIEARDYLLSQAQTDFSRTEGVSKDWMVWETCRVTSCLMQVMAWAMLHRSKLAGEIASAEAEASINQILRIRHIGQISPLTPSQMSADLASLISRSQALLERVVRISERGLMSG